MTWPAQDSSSNINTTNTDAGTDSPASARSDILALINEVNSLKALVNSIIGNGQPLTLGGSEAATAYVNAALGLKVGNVARSDVNTLDWYQEGTWTPVASFGSASVGIVYGSQYGKYTRIGNAVFFSLVCQWSNKGSSTGLLRISLPFPPAGSPTTTVPDVFVTDMANGVTLHAPFGQPDTGGGSAMYIIDCNPANGALVGLDNTTFAAPHGYYQGITATGMYFVS